MRRPPAKRTPAPVSQWQTRRDCTGPPSYTHVEPTHSTAVSASCAYLDGEAVHPAVLGLSYSLSACLPSPLSVVRSLRAAHTRAPCMVVPLGLLLRHSDRAQGAAHIAPVAERSATHWGLPRHPLLLLTGMPAAPPKGCGANHPIALCSSHRSADDRGISDNRSPGSAYSWCILTQRHR